MTSKEAILKKIRDAKVPFSELSIYNDDVDNSKKLYERYIKYASLAGVRVVACKHVSEVDDRLASLFPKDSKIFSATDTLPESLESLNEIDVCLVHASLGVAENGAVWISELESPNRMAPFIAKHLAIVLHATNIVDTMSDAYARLKINETGYGVFIAGPSKTADIEQSLVVGAHGPLSSTLFLIN